MEQLSAYLTQPVATLLGAVATLLGVVLLAYLGYVFGRWKTQHERLYERRAEVIVALFERFVDVDQKFYSLVHPADFEGEPNKQEKAKLAGESFNELHNYFLNLMAPVAGLKTLGTNIGRPFLTSSGVGVGSTGPSPPRFKSG